MAGAQFNRAELTDATLDMASVQDASFVEVHGLWYLGSTSARPRLDFGSTSARPRLDFG